MKAGQSSGGNGLRRRRLVLAVLLSFALHALLLYGVTVLSRRALQDHARTQDTVSLSIIQQPAKPPPVPEPKEPVTARRERNKHKPSQHPPRGLPTASPTLPPAPGDQPSPTPGLEQMGPPPPSLAPAAVPSRVPVLPTVQLKTDFAAMERAFGPELAAEQKVYEEMLLAKRRGNGGGYGALAGRVKEALETNTGWVQPGNQEPLGPRNQSFRSYIEIVHDKIHVLFADGFLRSLLGYGSAHPLNNLALVTSLEFEILSSGAVSGVRVVKTSGSLVFDAAAVDSILRSGPYPPPPRSILSYNDHVYLRWGFFRNERKCGPFNAEPFILRSPDGKKEAVPIDKRTITDG